MVWPRRALSAGRFSAQPPTRRRAFLPAQFGGPDGLTRAHPRAEPATKTVAYFCESSLVGKTPRSHGDLLSEWLPNLRDVRIAAIAEQRMRFPKGKLKKGHPVANPIARKAFSAEQRVIEGDRQWRSIMAQLQALLSRITFHRREQRDGIACCVQQARKPLQSLPPQDPVGVFGPGNASAFGDFPSCIMLHFLPPAFERASHTNIETGGWVPIGKRIHNGAGNSDKSARHARVLLARKLDLDPPKRSRL